MTPPGEDDTTPPRPASAQGDNDRTRFSPGPVQPGPDAAHDERTRFMPTTPPPPVEDDRTRFAAPTTPPGPEAEDRTRFAPPVATTPPPPPAPAEDAGPSSGLPPLPPPRDPTLGPATPSGRNVIAIGTVINNNYRIEEVLKAGGMGEVYRGVEVGTGDPVAIKVVLPQLAEDAKIGLMFQREARTLRQLQDDTIVRYYNYVHDPAIDRYCLVMEFIKGIPLKDYAATHGALSAEVAAKLMRRLAGGLAKAHAREVIHRDLSPDNVMLPHANVAEAVLIDFGIAKSNVVREGTMAGEFAGKFKYVAPEQLGAYDGVIGPRTDIYGLALLIAAALNAGPIDMGSSIIEAVQRRQSIPDLSMLPAPMQPILAHMLEPDPAHRPADMTAVIRLIDHPEELPAKYLGSGGLAGYGLKPGDVTAAPRNVTLAPQTQRVQGFQAPPMPGMVMSAAPGTVTGHPVTQRAPLPPPEPARGSGGALGLLTLAFLAVLGAAGYYAWSEGMIPGLEQESAEAEPPAPPPAVPPQANSRDGFLAGFDTGACTYAARIGAGPRAGMIEGFASGGDAFAGLPTAYEEQFGARPDVLKRQVTAAQCAALAFARQIQGQTATGIDLLLEADEVISRAAVTGGVTDPARRALWLAVISPSGNVFNLTERLSEPVGDSRRFRFGLQLGNGAEAAPQLVMAVASPAPLVAASTAASGVPAADLLPRIAEELAAGGGAVSLGFMMLVPEPVPEVPAPEVPAPEEAAPDGSAPEGAAPDVPPPTDP